LKRKAACPFVHAVVIGMIFTMRIGHLAALAFASIAIGSTALYAESTTRSIWDGVYTDAQADQGKAGYSNYCAKCHGGTLDGADEVPGLKGSNFLADWETQSVADLVTRIHSTMPMDNPGALSISSTTQLVAYLMQQNKLPAGNTDLPADLGILGQIRVDAEKPSTNGIP
jgi:mono/diheme cytochrome c family protein